MKIAIIIPLAEQKGGAELLFEQLMSHWQDNYADLLIIFLEDGSMVQQIQALGIETSVILAGRLREPYRFIKTVIEIAAIVKSSGVNLIFSWMTKAHLYSSLAAKLTGIPALWYQHGVPSSENWMDKIATMLPSKGVLTCSKTSAEAQKKLRPIVPINVVYPCVDLDRFNPERLLTPQEIRQKLELPTQSQLIGIIARLQRWKGIHILVEAMSSVLQFYPDAYCVVIGGKHDLEPNYQDYLKEQIKKFGVEERVKLVGLQQNIPEWMQAMDIIVHASDHEPFGMVILEAMALGKPIIATNTGGPTEIVTDGIDGLLTPYGNSSALAQAILCYLNHPEFACQLGIAAKKRVNDFSSQNYVRNFKKAINHLITTTP
ncbi:glycosyltransferase [Chroococcus sp. FPU101]|uniref:glycosyltransferase n=1 Tax=Chroococcus sp. FPU101 TaxID=1974212 RepID=UPI001A8C1078|nr:glycosyltransferase [Chroococcus sp. FPU101]GFE68197.1 glycosyl transferase, group 1 [Chroococcus sp. FPU101]